MSVSYDDIEVFKVVIKVCAKLQADPSDSPEAKAFYENLLKEYGGEYDMKQLRAWLEERLPQHYVALKKRPHWIQSPDWPFHGGQPMIFVGQIDVKVTDGSIAEKHFHDHTSFYVFMSATVAHHEVIVQQF